MAYHQQRNAMDVLRSTRDGSCFWVGGRGGFLRYWKFDPITDMLVPPLSGVNGGAFVPLHDRGGRLDASESSLLMVAHAGDAPALPANYDETIVALDCGLSTKDPVVALTASKKVMVLRDFALDAWIDLSVDQNHSHIVAS